LKMVGVGGGEHAKTRVKKAKIRWLWQSQPESLGKVCTKAPRIGGKKKVFRRGG